MPWGDVFTMPIFEYIMSNSLGGRPQELIQVIQILLPQMAESSPDVPRALEILDSLHASIKPELIASLVSTQLELAEINTKIMKDITQNIMNSGFDGVIIVASNPVDLMTYVVAETSGLPKSRVIGSGTVLDTARLRYIMSSYFKVSSKNIHAYIMGEHGDSSFVPWNHAYLGCKKIIDIMKDNNHPMEDLEKMHKDVVNSAYEIINKKRATYYGIGMALSKLVKAVLDNENCVLTVSTYLKNGEYGQDDIYIGVPAVVNGKGVRELINLELDKDEQKKLNKSCSIIKEMRKNSIDKIIKE